MVNEASAEPSAAEWWQRWGDGWRTWLRGDPRRLRAVRILGIVLVFAVVVAVGNEPRFDRGFRAWSVCWLMLVGWMLVTFTRSLRVSSILRVFSISVLWAFAVAWFSAWLARRLGYPTNAAGPGVGIASAIEEALKLAPLAALALLAPGRVRRFGASDWAIAGIAAGMGFQAAEDFVRRATLQPSIFDFFENDWRYSWSLFGGGFEIEGVARYPSHHVSTALIAAMIGLGVAGWRTGGRWRWASTAAPLAWLWMVSIHAAFNAAAADSAAVANGSSRLPGWLEAIWDTTGNGRGVGLVLTAAIVTAMAIDARRQAPVAVRRKPQPWPPPGRPAPAPAQPTGAERLAGEAGASLRSIGQVLVRTWRAAIAGWHSAADQSGLRHAVHTLGALEQERRNREMAVAGTSTTRGERRRARLITLTVSAIGCALAVLLATSITRQIGDNISSVDGEWFAGLLEALGDVWDGLGPGGKGMVVAAGLGLLLVGGGFFAFPMVMAGGELVMVGTASTAVTLAGASVLTMSAVGEASGNIEGGGQPGSGSSAPKGTSPKPQTTADKIDDVLERVDAGQPPAEGMKGGAKWRNDGRGGGASLPSSDASGTPIRYREWDINPRSPAGRDAERVVTGSDGSAWYTSDHYTTFTRIR